MWVSNGGWKRASDFSELELPVVVSYLIWVLCVLNTGPLKEQQVISTTESTLQLSSPKEKKSKLKKLNFRRQKRR